MREVNMTMKKYCYAKNWPLTYISRLLSSDGTRSRTTSNILKRNR